MSGELNDRSFPGLQFIVEFLSKLVLVFSAYIFLMFKYLSFHVHDMGPASVKTGPFVFSCQIPYKASKCGFNVLSICFCYTIFRGMESA